MADDTPGAGQQDPTSSTSEYNAQTFVIEQLLSKISTTKVVQVKAVDTTAKTVSVLPLVKLADGDDNVTAQGVVLDIPYMIWQYGKNAVLADPAVDDIGLLLCADRDISSVKATKAEAPPGSQRQYDVSDGIYLGGVLNGAPEQWVKFTATGMELHDKNSNVLVSSSSGWEFTGAVKFNQVVTMEAALQLGGSIENVSGGVYTGDFNTTGTVTGGTDVVAGTSPATMVTMKGHFHSANNTPATPGH